MCGQVEIIRQKARNETRGKELIIYTLLLLASHALRIAVAYYTPPDTPDSANPQ